MPINIGYPNSTMGPMLEDGRLLFELRCSFCGRMLAQYGMQGEGVFTLRIKCKCRAFNTKSIRTSKNIVQNEKNKL